MYHAIAIKARAHTPITLLIMSFYCPIVITAMIEQCNPGKWLQSMSMPSPAATGLVCIDCPHNMQCKGGISPPEPCPPGTQSLGGGTKCCSIDAACPE